MFRRAAAALCACLFVGGAPERAGADIVVSVNKSTQTLSVLIDGAEVHNWAVSTGLGGGPPNGTFKPIRFERRWFSTKYHNAPMPFSIFFHEGYAIHGTIHLSRIGRRASKGCVRLHPANAAVLFDLVRANAGKTKIVIATATHVAATVPPAAPKAEAPKAEPPKVEPPKVEAAKFEAPKPEAPVAEPARVEVRAVLPEPASDLSDPAPSFGGAKAAPDVTGSVEKPRQE